MASPLLRPRALLVAEVPVAVCTNGDGQRIVILTAKMMKVHGHRVVAVTAEETEAPAFDGRPEPTFRVDEVALVTMVLIPLQPDRSL